VLLALITVYDRAESGLTECILITATAVVRDISRKSSRRETELRKSPADSVDCVNEMTTAVVLLLLLDLPHVLGRSSLLQSACLYVCLSASVSQELDQIACCPWLASPLTALQYATYFRFSGLRRLHTIGEVKATTTGCVYKRTVLGRCGQVRCLQLPWCSQELIAGEFCN